MKIPRLDVMIYAHDGRGLGHASRSAAIGMALRRLDPQLRVLLVSGCKQTATLIDNAPLDWIKLPAYETTVINGKSTGVAGHSNYSDIQLGHLRGEMIRALVARHRPRVVLADHTPQGKHRELLPALKTSRSVNSRWLLGVRGIVGQVSQIASPLAKTTFQNHYHGLLWYGDRRILGGGPPAELQVRFGIEPVETGYVCRLAELVHWRVGPQPSQPKFAGTISVPWLGEKSRPLVHTLGQTLNNLGDAHGTWRIFIAGGDHDTCGMIEATFEKLPSCRVSPVGPDYADALLYSKLALIYGGYNSLTDVLWSRRPAVVLVREMQDSEQLLHLERLQQHLGAGLRVIPETGLTAETLANAIENQLRSPPLTTETIGLAGAERAARHLMALIQADA